jgi:tryptophanyl-tRNA synthetase
MSKSYNNTIGLFEEEKVLRKKIMSIVTDSTPVEAPKDPAASSVVALYRLFASPADVAAMEESFRAGGKGYGEFKKQLFEAIWLYFEPMRQQRAQLAADAQRVDAILADGARRASIVAEETLARVRAAVGLG